MELNTQEHSCYEKHSNDADGIHYQTQNILFHNRTILKSAAKVLHRVGHMTSEYKEKCKKKCVFCEKGP